MTRARPALPVPIELPDIAGRHLNALIYGDSGAGKTLLAGTAVYCEATRPVLFIDVDSGVTTLDSAGILDSEWIDIVRPRSWTDFQKIYEFLANDNDYYRCVVVDSLTEIQRKFSMGTILGEIGEGVDTYNDLGRSPVPTRQDWMRTGDQMRKLIRALRDLAYLPDPDRRVHVIMVALEKHEEKRKVICPALSGALGMECGAFVDILARLSRQVVVEDDESGEPVERIRRHLLTDDWINDLDIRHMAKDRTRRLGRGIWDPTIADIMGAVQ